MRTELLPQYELTEERFIREADSRASLLRHRKTGARIVVMENADTNKVFSIAFRTPPADNTGVAHIIEHTVLCGSERYPVKDPFIELVKGSLNTFLNAMTYSDKTVYPVASTNEKDFKNLMSVYLDAVFHPNILKERMIFEQEGWHYELEKADDPLTINGVVYNEMKGAFSSADEVVERYTKHYLFPDTTYGFESGGDPEEIPELTYEKYLDFYRTYYHPSNCYIFLYGDADMEERLAFIDREYLSGFDHITVDSGIPLQKPFEEPVRQHITYAAGEDDEEKGQLVWAKVFGEYVTDRLTAAHEVLEYALLNAPGAPLKQALLDAGLGDEVFGGVNDGLRQHFFEVVARNVDESRAEEFTAVIESTLRDVAEKGINRRSLLAAINSMEFRLREGDYGRLPKGLIIGLGCLDSWLYDDGDPFRYVEYEDMLAWLKEKVDTGYYEELIRKLIDNPYGLLLSASPDKDLDARREEELDGRLKAVKEALSGDERDELVRHTGKLKEYQETPSSPEELKKIPLLDVSDIRRKVTPLSNELITAAGIPVLYHDVPTAGIIYLNFIFDAGSLNGEELKWASLLRSCLGVMDTENYRYQDLIDEINIHTGGMAPDFFYVQESPASEPRLYFCVKVKAVYDELPAALSLAGELISRSVFTDKKRLSEILAEKQLQQQSALRNSGHSTAIHRALSHFSKGAWITEMTGGTENYEFTRGLHEHFAQEKENISEKLTSLYRKLMIRSSLMVSCTAGREGLEALKMQLPRLVEGLPDTGFHPSELAYTPQYANEAFACPSQVQYVARVGDFAQAGLPYTGQLQVLENILNYEYLWVQIRSLGGAYGCFSNFSRTGECFMASYRDPQLKETLDVFERSVQFLEGFRADRRAMTRYIIGAVSELDIPKSPAALGTRSLNAWLTGVTEEQLQRERDELLSATEESIRGLLPYVRALLDKKTWCVVGGEETIQENAELFDQVRQL